MAHEVEITDVSLSSPRLAEPDMERGEQKQWVDIAITVRNRSPQKTYHVVTSLRFLRYDAGTRTLILGLSEPEVSPEAEMIHLFPPSVTPVQPGESTVIPVSVPLVLNRILPSTGFQLKYESLDLSAVQHIECSIAAAETAFRPIPDEPAAQMMKRLQSWGEATRQTFERTLPTKPPRKPRRQRRKK